MSIEDNVRRVEEQMDAACRNANRPRSSVRLMAVSKTHPVESILEAYAAGVRLFGENRVQEYGGKRDALASGGILAGRDAASFHCIGPVQSNKAARAVQLFDGVDTVDSLRLAERLNQAAAGVGKRLPVFIEIKLSPEPAKHGLAPDTADLEQLLERLPEFDHLQVCGLMTVPPYSENPDEARPYFRRLRLVRDSLARRHPKLAFGELSMGMSHDFSVAIQEGATLVRIGTAIFGDRTAPGLIS